jgi:hypothetical protein
MVLTVNATIGAEMNMLITDVAAVSWSAPGGVDVPDEVLQSMADYAAGLVDGGASLEAVEEAVETRWPGLSEVGAELVGTELHVVVIPAHKPVLTVVR